MLQKPHRQRCAAPPEGTAEQESTGSQAAAPSHPIIGQPHTGP